MEKQDYQQRSPAVRIISPPTIPIQNGFNQQSALLPTANGAQDSFAIGAIGQLQSQLLKKQSGMTSD